MNKLVEFEQLREKVVNTSKHLYRMKQSNIREPSNNRSFGNAVAAHDKAVKALLDFEARP